MKWTNIFVLEVGDVGKGQFLSVRPRSGSLLLPTTYTTSVGNIVIDRT